MHLKRRTCTECKITKPIHDFPMIHSKIPKDGGHYYYYKCKDCRNAYTRRYGKKNKEILRKKDWLRDEKYPIKRWATQTLIHHKLKKRKVNITSKELVELGKHTKTCLFCGSSLVYSQHRGLHIHQASLDRIDGSPMTRIICFTCNMIKGTFSDKEFVRYCKHIVDNPKLRKLVKESVLVAR